MSYMRSTLGQHHPGLEYCFHIDDAGDKRECIQAYQDFIARQTAPPSLGPGGQVTAPSVVTPPVTVVSKPVNGVTGVTAIPPATTTPIYPVYLPLPYERLPAYEQFPPPPAITTANGGIAPAWFQAQASQALAPEAPAPIQASVFGGNGNMLGFLALGGIFLFMILGGKKSRKRGKR